MYILSLHCAEAAKDLLIAELSGLGTTGVVEHDLPDGLYRLEACFQKQFPADGLSEYSPEWSPADETNWARIIMDTWDPVCVGEKFFVVPDWKDDPTPPGRIRLEVRPGLALGTGYHPTTQMCLEAMEKHLKPGATFFELGCGTGILSHAAWLLGERTIIASDIDPQAIESAAENLDRWKVPVRLLTGSTGAAADNEAGFLVANISADTLLELVGEVTRCLSPGGIAVLSGFEPSRIEAVRQGYEVAGYETLSTDARDDWGCCVVRKRDL